MTKFLETALVFIMFRNIRKTDLFLNCHSFSNQTVLCCAKMYESVYKYITVIAFKLTRFLTKFPIFMCIINDHEMLLYAENLKR